MWKSVRERAHLGDPGIDGRIILRWIFRKWGAGGGVVFKALRYKPVGGGFDS